MKILTWNINGLRASNRRLKDVLDSLDADVVCLQETKITRDMLDEPLAIVQGYNAYFSFSRKRSGYSGTANFCRDGATPLAAEEGLTGRLASQPEGSVGCYGNSGEFEEEELRSLDGEGRAVLTLHQMQLDGGNIVEVVIINVYVPRAGDREDRWTYKLRFLALLQARAESLLRHGKHVIVLGDLNITHKKIDHCDPSTQEYLRSDARQWLDQILRPEDRDPDLRSIDNITSCQAVLSDAEGGHFVDAFRFFYPRRAQAYTNWCTVTGARRTNYGRRLDYILVDRGLQSALMDCWILADFEGSDHCPVVLRLKGRAMAAGRCPPLCSRLMPEFSGRQQTLSSFFRATHSKSSDQNKETTHSKVSACSETTRSKVSPCSETTRKVSACSETTRSKVSACSETTRSKVSACSETTHSIEDAAQREKAGLTGEPNHRQKPMQGPPVWACGKEQGNRAISQRTLSVVMTTAKNHDGDLDPKKAGPSPMKRSRSEVNNSRGGKRGRGAGAQGSLLQFLTRPSSSNSMTSFVTPNDPSSVTPKDPSSVTPNDPSSVTPNDPFSVTLSDPTSSDTHTTGTDLVVNTERGVNRAEQSAEKTDCNATDRLKDQTTNTERGVNRAEQSAEKTDCNATDRLKDQTTNTERGVSEETTEGSSRSKGQSNAVCVWKTLLSGPPPPPLCRGHGEPCVLRTVKKPGPTKGRQFFCCARPEGDKTNKEARCQTFVWLNNRSKKS